MAARPPAPCGSIAATARVAMPHAHPDRHPQRERVLQPPLLGRDLRRRHPGHARTLAEGGRGRQFPHAPRRTPGPRPRVPALPPRVRARAEHGPAHPQAARVVSAAASGPRLRLPAREPSARRRQRSADPLRRGQHQRQRGQPAAARARRLRSRGRRGGPAHPHAPPLAVPRGSAAGRSSPRRDVERHRHEARLRPEPAAALDHRPLPRLRAPARTREVGSQPCLAVRLRRDPRPPRRTHAEGHRRAAAPRACCPPAGRAFWTGWTRTATGTPSGSPRI